MTVYAYAQIKGGVGKTTLATNTAIERVIRGKRDVLLVDSDDQATATDFSNLRAELKGATGYTSIQLAGAAVRTQVLAQRGKYDDIVIDVGGRDTAALRSALTVADIAIIPFQPRSFDVWVLEKVNALIAEARGFNPDLIAVAVINLADPQGADNKEAAEIIAASTEITYLQCPIGRRKAFGNAAGQGLSVLELHNQDSKASMELKYLIDKLNEIIAR